MHCIVTGGAGFIGSHLVDHLLARGDTVTVIDSMVAGRMANLEHNIGALTAFKHADLLEDGWQPLLKGADRVYHIAADPDVRGSARKSLEVYHNNVTATVRLLEAMKEHSVKEIIFTSTSTVYGEAATIPTPETYAPMTPISIYGASKLACEAMISAYAATYGMKAWIYRFANIIGARSTHGVIYDFIQKLRNDPTQLEILGNGSQSKSYLAVENCVAAMTYAPTISNDTFNVYNIGSEGRHDLRPHHLKRHLQRLQHRIRRLGKRNQNRRTRRRRNGTQKRHLPLHRRRPRMGRRRPHDAALC